MRVAIVTETFLPKMDGIVRFLLEMLGYCRRHDHDALIFCPGDGPDTALDFPVIRAKAIPFPSYPELQLTLRSNRMVGALRAWRPDVVHLAGPALLGAQGLRVGRLLGLPVAGHFQTNLPQYARHYGLPWLAAFSWRYLVALHNGCTCNYTSSGPMTAECQGHGMRRVQTLPRGVSAGSFSPQYRSDDLRRSWGAAADQTVFLTVGRVAAEKNLDRLVDLAAAAPECRLVIVGDGPYRAALAARLGAAAHFTGELHGEALAAAYASADVFAFPSRTETFGLVALEAMASGLPVLAMRAGGVPDSVQDGRTGLLCDPTRPAEWTTGARRLAAAPQLRRAMGESGLAVARERTWDATFDRLFGEYQEIIAGAATP